MVGLRDECRELPRLGWVGYWDCAGVVTTLQEQGRDDETAQYRENICCCFVHEIDIKTVVWWLVKIV